MNIFAEALKTWAAEAQLGMTQEECAELIKVINKYFRGKASRREVIEECVDVDLMIKQMKELFKNDSDIWESIEKEKLERLKELLKK